METLDEVFGLLDRERRRYVLYYLKEAGGPVSVEELAAQIVAWENDSTREEVPDDAFEDVTLTLRHHHLPNASRAEYVEYDPDENVVRLSGTPTEFSIVLSVARAIEQPAGGGIVSLEDLV